MGKRENFGKRIAAGLLFRKAKERAAEISEDPEKLDQLLAKAGEKAEDAKKGPLKEVWASLMAMFRMLKAYGNGSYRKIPFKTLLAVIGSVVYFVMPFDVIPDMLVLLGFLDDAALIAWTVKSVKSDIDRFTAWEEERNENNDESMD